MLSCCWGLFYNIVGISGSILSMLGRLVNDEGRRFVTNR